MPQPVGVPEEPQAVVLGVDLAIPVEVGDVGDVGADAGLGVGHVDDHGTVDGPETQRQIHMLLLADPLIGENQDGVGAKGLLDHLPVGLRKRLRKIEIADLGGEGLADRPHTWLQGSPSNSGHAGREEISKTTLSEYPYPHEGKSRSALNSWRQPQIPRNQRRLGRAITRRRALTLLWSRDRICRRGLVSRLGRVRHP